MKGLKLTNQITEGHETFYKKCNCISEQEVTQDYIVKVDATNDSNPYVAIATADTSVVYNLDNHHFSKIWDFNHNDSVIECKFSNRDRNLVYIATNKGVITVWDLRTPKKCVNTFRDVTEEKIHKQFNCFDLSSNDRLLAAGTDVYEGDAYILFWDSRNSKLLGAYWESHEDDITQVKFHFDDMTKLISGSTDGLINVYDLSQTCEDDALIDTLNTELSVHELLWFSKNKKDYISCVTHTSDLQLWDMDKGAPSVTSSSEQLAKKIIGTDSDEDKLDAFYLAKCCRTSNGLIIVAGQEDCHRISKIQNNIIQPFVELHDNKQRILDSTFNENTSILITVGERGLMNVWDTSKQFE